MTTMDGVRAEGLQGQREIAAPPPSLSSFLQGRETAEQLLPSVVGVAVRDFITTTFTLSLHPTVPPSPPLPSPPQPPLNDKWSLHIAPLIIPEDGCGAQENKNNNKEHLSTPMCSVVGRRDVGAGRIFFCEPELLSWVWIHYLGDRQGHC